MFALRNSLFACSVRGARERSFEEARGETEVGRHRLLPPLALEPRPLLPLAPRTRPAGTQTEPQLEPATSADVILPETGHSCCHVRYSCGNNCDVVVELVQEHHSFFYTFYFRSAFCGNSSPLTTRFLGRRTVTSERSR